MENLTTFVLIKQNILHNLDEIKKNTKSKICVMIKADGYGYGMKNIATILDEKVDFFGVANMVEALKLRRYNIKTNILVCGVINEELVLESVKNNISFSITSYNLLKRVNNILKKTTLKAKLHLKLNSGMNRLGITNVKEFKKCVKLINESKNLILEGVFTHNGQSECENKQNLEKTHTRFLKMINSVSLNKNTIIHFSNSGAFMYNKDYHHDMVRIGKLLYGVNASFSKSNLNLLPIFKLSTKVYQIQKVKKNELIGYGEKVKFNTKKEVAILPLGYGDGFIQSYTGANVVINNQKFKIIGICMDLTIIDITNSNVKVGDDVLVMGISQENTIPVNNYSSISQCTASQVVANLNKSRFNQLITD